MTTAAALAACEATVRRADPDHYLATLFAPAAARPILYALYAFNHEVARAGDVARDPFAAEIRLQWWRGALEAARDGHPPAHPVAVGLAEILSRDRAQATELESLIDARVIESSPLPFSTLAAMERHARATSGRLMRIAVCMITGTRGSGAAVDDAGIAYGLTGMLRSFRFHVLRGKVFLPADLLAAECLSTADIARGESSGKLKRVFKHVGTRAMDHFRQARHNAVPHAAISAVLPASLVPAYLSRLAKNIDHFRENTDILHLRKQLIMLRAALGRHL